MLRYREAMLEGYHAVQTKGFLNTNTIIAIQRALEEKNAGLRTLSGTTVMPVSSLTAWIWVMYQNDQDDYHIRITWNEKGEEFENIKQVMLA